MGTLFVDKLDPQSGTSLELGSSGDTMTVPSGATLTIAGTINASSGTATGFGESNTPAFSVYRSSSQSIANDTATKIQFNAENYDTDNAFDSSTNYRFTVPSGKGGKYFFTARARSSNFTSVAAVLTSYINGSSKIVTSITNSAADGSGYHTVTSTWSMTLADSDYVEMYYKHNNGSTQNIQGDSGAWGLTAFAGFRISS